MARTESSSRDKCDEVESPGTGQRHSPVKNDGAIGTRSWGLRGELNSSLHGGWESGEYETGGSKAAGNGM
jgi:hypothetical protein